MGSRSCMEMGKIFGERGAHCKVYGHSSFTCAKAAEPIVMPFGLWAQNGPSSGPKMGVRIPHERGNFGGKGRPL